MPRVSVVVPIYNVEPFLEACLASLVGQTFTDLEVVMVNDGSTDRSLAIAEAFAARDPRFRVISQPNGGLSRARNTGVTAATGEFLAFADSDDVVDARAYELLVGTLDRTGSDFASGNVHRLTGSGTRQSRFLARTFAETRLKTHITRDRLLIHDRTVWNKLWRRSFWDRQGRRFPDGRTYEDIPVTLPLHFAARSVDVLADVVYYWRTREGEQRSITQNRAEPRALDDRLTAIAEVSGYLARHGPRRAKRWYDASVVGDDLKYFLNALDEGDDEFHALFLDRVNAFLAGVSPGAFRRLPGLERVKWELVRRRMLPELLELLRWQREDMPDTAPVCVRGHWYLDHPFRTELPLPPRLWRIDRDLVFRSGLDVLEWRDGRLRIEGWAFIEGAGAPNPRSQRLAVKALQPGRLRPLRLRLGGLRMRATPLPRPDLMAVAGTELSDVSWAGFAATLDPRRLRSRLRRRERRLDLYLTARTGRVWRARSRFTSDAARPLRAAPRVMPDGTLVVAEPAANGALRLRVLHEWALLGTHGLEGDALRLTGELRSPARTGLELEARRRGSPDTRRFPLALETRGSFSVRIPIADLTGGGDATWELFVVGSGRPLRLIVREDAPDGAWPQAGCEVALARPVDGAGTLLVRPPGATVLTARWTADGALELGGDLRAAGPGMELVLRGRRSLRELAFPLERSEHAFRARLTPAAIPSLAGLRPLSADAWDLLIRGAGDADPVPVTLSTGRYAELPIGAVIDHKPFNLGATREGDAVLLVDRDHDGDERGGRQQRRLRATIYAGGRTAPLRDAVVYLCFGGRQYSDNPRAIHEELVRRGAPLEHLWVVHDGRCRAPATAAVLRSDSGDYYEALARARYVVSNDHFPVWFERRPDQLSLQTWHGTPLKRLGFDVPGDRKFARRWDRQLDNWQYVLSPNRFSTPIMRRAYALTGELLETGYPRADRLAGDDRDRLGAAVRRRLGLPAHARVVLYAPTYRDHARDRDGRYRLEAALEVERLRDALGRDAVVLFRKHHYVVDPVPATDDGFIRDVSDYPDGTELLLAADVLVTDYSSMMFDFAITGRPMVFFTYDLDAYRDEIRGFYFDFEARSPGPLVGTPGELAERLGDVGAVTAEYADRYRAFVADFCELDDGHAAARVVDRLFGVPRAGVSSDQGRRVVA